jgi:UDP-glucose 4-epimerase
VTHVLVTGASGFIGRHACASLHERGGVVRATSRSATVGTFADEWMRADLVVDSLEALVKGVDAIVHCAGVAHAHAVALDDDEAFAAGNVEATRRLCEAARGAGVSRVVLASSVAIFGEPGVEPVAEDAPPAPASAYARSKREAERIVLEMPQAVVLRFPLVYGAGLPGNLARMIDASAAGRFPRLPPVANRRSMIHVADAARSLVLAATDPRAAGVYTVTDGRAYATHEIAAWIDAALGRPARGPVLPRAAFRWLAALGDAGARLLGRRLPFDGDGYRRLFGSAAYRSDRLRADLGFVPQFDLKTAMPAIVAAHRGGGDTP